MKIVNATAEIISFTPNLEQVIELAGRTCYKSEDKITEDSAHAFIERIKNFKHESVLEHGSITVRFVVDRGVSHELVRHRLASFSQESTRYCNYGKDKFGNEITVIKPCFFSDERDEFDPEGSREYWLWSQACQIAESCYFDLLACGATPQEARSVLPNSLKTEVVMTANPREWRWVFALRCHKDAHPQMREVMVPLLAEFIIRWPALFGDLAPLIT
jgi:thymidylate synthase (FAD)